MKEYEYRTTYTPIWGFPRMNTFERRDALHKMIDCAEEIRATPANPLRPIDPATAKPDPSWRLVSVLKAPWNGEDCAVFYWEREIEVCEYYERDEP
jgi:hypothetical protein